MRYLHYRDGLCVTSHEEELPEEDGVIVAIKGSGFTLEGEMCSRWYLSDPWRGHTVLDVTWNYWTCKAQVKVDGDVVEKLKSHSEHEVLAALGFRVLLED